MVRRSIGEERRKMGSPLWLKSSLLEVKGATYFLQLLPSLQHVYASENLFDWGGSGEVPCGALGRKSLPTGGTNCVTKVDKMVHLKNSKKVKMTDLEEVRRRML